MVKAGSMKERLQHKIIKNIKKVWLKTNYDFQFETCEWVIILPSLLPGSMAKKKNNTVAPSLNMVLIQGY